MHKIRLTIMTVILIITVSIAPVYANLITEDSIISDDIVSYSTISHSLREELKNAGEDELIQVTIELNTDFNLEEVEELAVSRANLSTEEISLMRAMSADAKQEEDETTWAANMKVLRKISKEKTAILEEYHVSANNEFIQTAGLSDKQIGSVGYLLPFIRDVLLTPAEIRKLALDDRVCFIDHTPGIVGHDFDTVSNTYQIINGDVAVSDGYKGSGIRVGVIEKGNPLTGPMTSDAVYMYATDSGPCIPHVTRVCGIIKKMAHDCSIYTRTASDLSDVSVDCEYLIKNYDVDVINVSYGVCGSGYYTAYSRAMDRVVWEYGVPVVVASGNTYDGYTASQLNVNYLGAGPNVITVGAVASSGTEQSATGAYTLADYSIYKENISVVNKPDICAPGTVQIYSYEELGGTSYAAPHVTGTIVQMMSKNSALKKYSEVIKAILMSSAFYDGGTSMTYAGNGTISNYEGAGVVDAGFCYQSAADSRYFKYTFTSNTGAVSYNINCSSTSTPLRIACAWHVTNNDDDTVTYHTNYDLYVYKNGSLVTSSACTVGSSSQPNTNYEIVELSPSVLRTYGTGTYQVKIVRTGSFAGSDSVRLGLAWGQQ